MKKSKNLHKRYAFLQSRWFAITYVGFAATALIATTLFWSLAGAHLHQGNADQLINSYLFEDRQTFVNAQLPSQHSFLIKWPLFYIVRLLNFSDMAFAAVTVITVLLTTGAFMLILKKLEPRPLFLGTILLALSSVLLLVPPQPGASGLLPVNMAMLATRNLEYIIYIVAIMGLAGVTSIKSRRFWFSSAGLLLLIASDKFFASLSLGGALLVLLAYALKKRWAYVNFSVRWLLAGIVSLAGSVILLATISAAHITTIIDQSSTSPYQLVNSFRDIMLGSLYATIGFFTNFGANPAYSVTEFRAMPGSGLHHLISWAGLGFCMNLIIMSACLYSMYWFVRASLNNTGKFGKHLAPVKLVVAMVFSLVAAAGAFVVTAHYYAGDARYLTIGLFAGFIALAAYVARKKLAPIQLVGIGIVLCITIISSLVGSLSIQSEYSHANQPIESRNNTVARILRGHHVEVLAGDYWRVLPIQQAGNIDTHILPLDSCTNPRQVLSSTYWQADLTRHSFAYLLQFDSFITGSMHCDLNQITAHYGRPNSSALVSGTPKDPQEVLLFYDQGAQPQTTAIGTMQSAATIFPVTAAQLPAKSCKTGLTSMNIVAHQDDDLLFMNPDILHDFQAGNCQRTVYITAGDAGLKFQWLTREQGSEAAYAQMLGVTRPTWTERTLELGKGRYVKVANLKEKPEVSLIFMHLPDGNLGGSGFAATGSQSLEKLRNNQIRRIKTVDGQSSYTPTELTDSLFELMQIYQPTLVRTQSTVQSEEFPDHSDHQRVSDFATEAWQRYQDSIGADNLVIPLSYYVGYPVRTYAANVDGDDLAQKEAAFFAYARHDGSVCGSIKQCANTPTYKAYLEHQIISNY